MRVATPLVRWEARAARALALSPRRRRTVETVSVLSHCGDHAALWLATALGGAAVDGHRRSQWRRAGQDVLVAHLGASALKRLIRRPRPDGPPLIAGLGQHSFPSSHAAASGAAALAFKGLLPAPVRLPLAVAVAWSRLALGAHHPADVACGAGLGALIAATAGRRRT